MILRNVVQVGPKFSGGRPVLTLECGHTAPGPAPQRMTSIERPTPRRKRCYQCEADARGMDLGAYWSAIEDEKRERKERAWRET